MGTVRITDPAISTVLGTSMLPGELRQAQRDRPPVAVLDEEQQREQELVPGDHEDVQSGRHDRRLPPAAG